LTIFDSLWKHIGMIVCDYLIVGGGNTGLSAAEKLNELNKTVVIVEAARLGGNNLNLVTIPQRIFYREARQFSRLISYFSDQGDMSQKLYEAREVVSNRIQTKILHKTAQVYKKIDYLGHVKQLFGEVSFTTKNVAEMVVDGKKISIKFKKCLLCVGKDSVEPQSIPGIEDVPCITRYSAYLLPQIPTKMAIIGLTLESMDVAAFYSSLGIDVVIFEEKPKSAILPGLDKSLLDHIIYKLQLNFVNIEFDTKVIRVDKSGEQIKIQDQYSESHLVSHIYVHVRETFDNSSLNLKHIKVTYNQQGIFVDQKSRTKQGHIYAFGSCTQNTDNTKTLDGIDSFVNSERKWIHSQHKTLTTKLFAGTAHLLHNITIPKKPTKRVAAHFYIDFVGAGMTETEAVGKYGPKVKIFVAYTARHSDFLKIIYFEKSQKIVGFWCSSFYKTRFESLLMYGMDSKIQASKIIEVVQVQMIGYTQRLS
jgi:pyruvate/2-oxoglutarate dehydrogenase complex dihydrolipoamide dehydrogenase (E3) component